MRPTRGSPLVGRFVYLLRLQVWLITAPTGRGSLLQANGDCGKWRGPRDVLAAASRNPHWPGAADCHQWELRSAEPVDVAGLCQRSSHLLYYVKLMKIHSTLFDLICSQYGLVPKKSLDDLNKWTLLLISPFIYSDKILDAEHIAFVTESVSAQADDLQTISSSSKKVIKWSDCCSPLAYKPGEPYKLIAEASVDNFSNLGIAFMEDRLQMDNGMVPRKIVSIHLQESALKELERMAASTEEKNSTNSIHMDELTPAPPFAAATKQGSASTDSTGGGDQEVREEKSRLEKRSESHDEPNNLSERETSTGKHHHLHLSSCHECFELENSTIESVRYASSENIPELPDDCSASVEEVTDGCLARELRRINLPGKTPNVLIYVGSDPMKIKFEKIKSVLKECIHTDSYTIYQLVEEQILKAPWLDNSLLLVIATEEPISKDNHKQFLTYLSRGGKILGLSASFTFGSIQIRSKSELKKTIQELVFYKADNSEVKLNLLTSGSVFEQEAKENRSQVKSLSHLSNTDKDMIIVHLPYGDCGGEAILCQIYLEMDIASLTTQTQEDFNLLKMSNAKRYEVLKEILTLLGLNCELSEVPSLTPIYLLASDEVSILLQLRT
ncbi:Biotin--protein ligase [Chelonia mydas]|uniref:Biotin--protein ligase n=1 Tax=Chelonia mydas TaxID=8469 RepID=M7AXR7_CHEMY|nr:Biotin--protein ligase [Chelonia mydas]